MEGNEPTLKHSLFNDLRDAGLRLDTPQNQPKPQKRPETRDKNAGRKVAMLPTRENNQEVQEAMSQSSTHESFAATPAKPEEVAKQIGESLQSDMTLAVRELHAMRQQFAMQHSLKSEGVRLAAYGVVTFAAFTGAALLTHAIINRGQPELPAGKPTK